MQHASIINATCAHTRLHTPTCQQKLANHKSRVSSMYVYKESMPRHMVLYVATYSPLFAKNKTHMPQHMGLGLPVCCGM